MLVRACLKSARNLLLLPEPGQIPMLKVDSVFDKRLLLNVTYCENFFFALKNIRKEIPLQ